MPWGISPVKLLITWHIYIYHVLNSFRKF
jgi:hypothetical protein